MKRPVRLVRLPSVLLTLTMIAMPAIMPAGEIPSTATAPASAPANATEATNGAEKETDDTASAASAKPDPIAADYWRAIKLLGSKVPADIEAGRIALKAASDLEYTHAQVLLGNCHLAGSYGFPKNAKKAANLFRLAAERDNAFAKVSLALCYYSGDGVGKDEAAAVTWLTAALASDADFNRPAPPDDFFSDEGLSGNLGNDPAAQSQATAHHLLGQILQRQKKDAEAQVHFVAAATAGANGQSGIYEAAQQAALNFAFGKGVPRDLAKANEMLDRARQLTARMGVTMVHNYASLKIVDEFAVADIEESITAAGAQTQSVVQTNIAETFADKKSKDYNPAEAVKWYELAAENGQAWAMLSLAFIYSQGDLGRPDPAKAFHWFEKAGGGAKPKHYLGTANLAICLYHGIGTTTDVARATALFTKHRNEDIVCYLGSIGQVPVSPVTYDEELKLNQTWAKDNPQAQYLLGLRHLYGFGVNISSDEAGRWFKKAAKANHGEALCQLGLMYQYAPITFSVTDQHKAAKVAADYYQKAGEAGSIEGLTNYANSLYTGYGLPRNEAKAIETYERCLKLDPNHSRAHANLGGIYNNKLLQAQRNGVSVGTGEWQEKMLEHYEASARQEVSFSAVWLGDLYYEGKLVKKNPAKAYRYYEQATDVPTQKANAHFRLGLMHENGEGVPVTYTEAAYHYRLAALEGNAEALRRLVNFYLTGQGVSRDLDRASFWLLQMARTGQPGALMKLCDIMLDKKDYANALTLLKNLADNFTNKPIISGYAHMRLSLCYEGGLGVKASPAKAEKHFKLAVERGDGDALITLAKNQIVSGQINEAIATYKRAAKSSPNARYDLGRMYFFGTHVEKDPAEAITYLRQAADDNHAGSLYFLAGLTWNNNPYGPALDEAIRYARQAENLGYDNAAVLREKLEKRRQKNIAAPEDTAKARSS